MTFGVSFFVFMATIKPRDYKFELIRVLAIFAVIGVHTVGILLPDGTALRQFSIYFMGALFALGNGLFFMMSGKFALRNTLREDKYGDFYFKKFVYLILPLLIYMFLYSVGDLWENTGSFAGFFKKAVVDMTHNYSYGSHFWFMFSLVGFILLSPFIARSLEGLSKKGALILIGMGFAFNAVYAYTPYFTGNTFSWTYPYSMWTTFFLMGGCFDKIVTTSLDKKIVVVLGVLGLAIILLKDYFFSYKQFIYDLAPSYPCYVIMVYFLLQQIDIKNEKIQSVIRFVGKRTFGIYLIHFAVIKFFYSHIAFASSYISGVPYLLYVMVVIFLISMVLSYLFELFFLNQIQKGFEAIRKYFS